MSIQIKIPSAEKFVYINIGHDWAHHILPMIEETQSKHENGDFSEFTKDLINKLLFAGDNPKITYEENPHVDLYEVTADKILVNGKEPNIGVDLTRPEITLLKKILSKLIGEIP